MAISFGVDGYRMTKAEDGAQKKMLENKQRKQEDGDEELIKMSRGVWGE